MTQSELDFIGEQAAKIGIPKVESDGIGLGLIWGFVPWAVPYYRLTWQVGSAGRSITMIGRASEFPPYFRNLIDSFEAAEV